MIAFFVFFVCMCRDVGLYEDTRNRTCAAPAAANSGKPAGVEDTCLNVLPYFICPHAGSEGTLRVRRN